MKADSGSKRVAILEPPSVEDKIRQRAYELFEARGGAEGHELDDWLRAEEEIKDSTSKALAA